MERLTSVFVLENSVIYNYLEGVDNHLIHPLENATLTKNLPGRVIQVTGDDAHDFPIISYSTDYRPEFLFARVCKEHIGKGEDTSKNKILCDIIRARGKGNDHAGHILGNQFGGPIRPYNLYPQNANANMGFCKADENMIIRWMKSGDKNFKLEYQARLIYEDSAQMRPNGAHFMIKFINGDRLASTEEMEEVVRTKTKPIRTRIEPILCYWLPNPPHNEQYLPIDRESEDYSRKSS